MGVNCRLLLPGNVRVDDVAMVLGKLAGLPAEEYSLGSGSVHCRVNGASVVQTGAVTMVEIQLFSPPSVRHLVDGDTSHTAYYHFESGHGSSRLMMPPSTSFWIAACRGLCDFFGGKLDHKDCDDIELDYEVRAKSDVANQPGDGEPYNRLSRRIIDLPALTKDEIERWRETSAYPEK